MVKCSSYNKILCEKAYAGKDGKNTHICPHSKEHREDLICNPNYKGTISTDPKYQQDVCYKSKCTNDFICKILKVLHENDM